MLHQPFYDPEKTYQENFERGPFGAFSDREVFEDFRSSDYQFFGLEVNSLFGIPAGPLLNSNFVKAALDKGFDICVYKTVRSRSYPCYLWPNVLAVRIDGNLTLEKAKGSLMAGRNYQEPLSITNSFGVPSTEPEFWQPDIAQAIAYAKPGQIVMGSFQGTKTEDGNLKAYLDDFVLTAKLLKEAGVKVLEVNLSCPNEGTADLLCFDVERVRVVVEAIKNQIGNTPLIVKIAHFQDDNLLGDFVKKIGSIVDGVSAINTIPAAIVDERGNQALPGKGRLRSGVCGQTIKWAGLDMVNRLKSLREQLGLTYTIIGVGGVNSVGDYEKYREEGADVVMSATGAMWNPYLAQEIKKEASKIIRSFRDKTEGLAGGSLAEGVQRDSMFDSERSTMMEQEVINILKKVGAIITDSHFVYVSGKHGDVYVNKDALYPHIEETSQIGMLFAQKFKDLDIDIVVAPALGGIILSQWTAHHLSKLKGKEVAGVFTEKDDQDNQILKRGYDELVKGKNVLVVEDVTTTGGSVKKAVESVKLAGGNVVAVSVMVNRDPENVTSQSIGAPFSPLAVFRAESFDPKVCPLCQNNVPINIDVGHGQQYLASLPSIIDKYNQRVDKVNSLVCVGLDSDFDKLPERFKNMEFPQFEFNKEIIETTHPYAAAYKANIAFYEARGDQGILELKMTIDYLKENYPDIFRICDCKRADIGNTNKGYVSFIMDWLDFDAMTLHPYLGGESLQPFLERRDKGCIILCRTSNPGSGEIQDLVDQGKPIWQIVAEKVKNEWNKNNNCLLVVGATYPEETATIRRVVGDMTFLMPGIGAQGGDVEAAVKAGVNSEGKGLIINSSRGIIFADNPKEETIKLRDEINKYR